jgi:hypothetical protein
MLNHLKLKHSSDDPSLFLNLLTSNPVAENMRSYGTAVPGILRY